MFSRSKALPESVVLQLDAVRSLVENLRSEVHTLRLELAAQGDLVTKRMRRAVAAERAVERNEDRGAQGVTPAPETPGKRPALWGARRRIADRHAAAAARDGTGVAAGSPTTEE